MTTNRTTLCFLLLCAVLWASCESKPEVKPDAKVSSIKPKEKAVNVSEMTYPMFMEKMIVSGSLVFCRLGIECRDQIAQNVNFLAKTHFATVKECTSAMNRNQSWQVNAQNEQKAIDAGMMKLNQASAKECLDFIENVKNTDCRGLYDLNNASSSNHVCAKILEGVRGLGESCEQTRHCAPVEGQEVRCNTTCEVVPASEMPCGRLCTKKEYCDDATSTCTLRREAQGACEGTYQCAPNHTCNRSKKQCIKNGSLKEGADCEGPSSCEYGLQCTPKAEKPWTKSIKHPINHCASITSLKQGDMCHLYSDRLCERGLQCARPQGSKEGVCAPLAKLGEACMESTQCTWGLFCDLNKEMTSGSCNRPMAKGSPCTLHSMEPYQCQSGFCDPETKACR